MSAHPGRMDNVPLSPDVEAYGLALEAAGVEPREIARAVRFAHEFGLDSLKGDGCRVFGEPRCGDRDCLNPHHQQWEKTDG